MTSYRRSNEPPGSNVERSTAGASGGGDLEERMANFLKGWQARGQRLQEALNTIPGVSATVKMSGSVMDIDVQMEDTD